MAEEFILTDKNYYSSESNRRYISTHQFLDAIGYNGVEKCEARMLATLNGEYEPEVTKPMVMGSFCDTYFEGTLDKFKLEHPEIFTQKGELRSEYKLCEKMIKRCEEDELFMKFMSGEKQRIMTADLFGFPFKIKMDSYIPGKCITDFKTSSNIRKNWYIPNEGHCDFTKYWGYTVQLAAYQRVVEINTGEKLHCYIAVVTKEDDPDIEVIEIDQSDLDEALNYIRDNIKTVQMLKDGDIEPIRCGTCPYCRRTKKLMRPINRKDLVTAG